jgi:hypothetical protein
MVDERQRGSVPADNGAAPRERPAPGTEGVTSHA